MTSATAMTMWQPTGVWKGMRTKDFIRLILRRLPSFRFVFRAGAEARPNERQKTLAWRLKFFKIGKLRLVILFDTLFQVIERGDIVLIK